MAEVTLFAAANLAYFYEHGYAFAKSAVDSGNYVHIAVWKDNKGDWVQEQKDFVTFLDKFYKSVDPAKCVVQLVPNTIMYKMKAGANIIEERAFFACVRFLLLENMVHNEYEQRRRGVMVLDIDSIVNQKIEIPDNYDIGVFLRTDNPQGTPYEMEGMKVAAGMLYVTPRAVDFMSVLRAYIMANEIRWFCDQIALYRAFNTFKDEMEVLVFNNDQLDWDFNEGTQIWTGKGARKHSDPTYVNRKKEIEDEQ